MVNSIDKKDYFSIGSAAKDVNIVVYFDNIKEFDEVDKKITNAINWWAKARIARQRSEK